ncbi:hypothetical protein [Brenneria corticis]|uniref:hypothetical protein n=1 Tax=Brenneria corticis TaxID=2173106 RepID=UPI00143D39B5|nr:hypothetical protein [Brenneria sp. CFCC 11842]
MSKVTMRKHAPGGPKIIIISQLDAFAGMTIVNELKTFQVCPTPRRWQYPALLILFFT